MRILFIFGPLIFAGCKRDSHPENRIQLTNPSKAMAATSAAQTAGLPDCPRPPKGDVPNFTGNHKVTLTWKPSSSSTGADDPNVGYCLYRMDEKDVGNIPTHLKRKDLGDCPDCLRVNTKAVSGTGCVDTRVKDGATYLYWAGAIRQGSDLSRFSIGTSATIQPNPNAPPQAGYRACQP